MSGRKRCGIASFIPERGSSLILTGIRLSIKRQSLSSITPPFTTFKREVHDIICPTVTTVPTVTTTRYRPCSAQVHLSSGECSRILRLDAEAPGSRRGVTICLYPDDPPRSLHHRL